ncbi:MAG: murein L,D-transpeptidase [Sphingomonas sp.]|nr:MAG: murein L,D-transpeptidase [Sphingomonas sp.]
MHTIISTRILLAAGGAALALPVAAQAAQVTRPPLTLPSLAPTPAAPAQPQVASPILTPTIALPRLTDAQATQLATLLEADVTGQGLAALPPTPVTGADSTRLIRQALDHARAVHAGRLETVDFQEDWGLRPPAYDPLPSFVAAVRSDRIAAWFASLPPPYAGYDGLKAGLARYRAIAASGGWGTLAAGPDMNIGTSGARVIALRKRLAVEDRDTSVSGDSYDVGLVDAVRRAQRRYGLNPSGIVSTQTLAALNVPAASRVRQIMANMERWRWLPQQMPANRIQVNIAAAVLTLFDGDRPIQSMRAVTGRPGDETPMLSSTIHSIVINPPWNVPTSIATRELWPKEKRNPGYLKRAGFKVIDGTRLQQQAGDQSALGRFKFDFVNPYSVYLHDTPSRAKFASFDRLASHGCVRLEKPAELAETLLSGDPYDWDGKLAAKIEARTARQAQVAQTLAAR